MSATVFKRLLLLAFVLGGIPYLVLEHGPRTPIRGYTLAMVLLIWGGLLIFGAIRRVRRKQKGALLFNLGFLLLALAAVEALAANKLKNSISYPIRPASGTYTQKDALMGYRGVPNSASRFKAVAGDDTVFDVTYTMDEHGLRIRPPAGDSPPTSSVLCFGCSFTYGSGIADAETWPWKLDAKLGDDVRVYNFAYNGYGPQQMLAAIEGGLVADVVTEPATHAVYLTFHDHVRRVSGKGGYAVNEPRFVLQEDGTPLRKGRFGDEATNVWSARLHRLLKHSNVAQLTMKAVTPDQYDMPLFVAVLKASRDDLRARWPDCRFHVVLWEDASTWGAAIKTELMEAGFEVWRAGNLIPGLDEDPAQYRIHALDGHPNPKATEVLAEALAERLGAP